MHEAARGKADIQAAVPQTDAATANSRVVFAHLLRGVAAASVLAHHFLYLAWKKPAPIGDLIAQPTLPALVEKISHVAITDFGVPNFWGHFGVALFFVVSGFVIPFSVSSFSPRGFLVARVLRIWPTYVVGLSIALTCIALNAARADAAFPFTLADVIRHYLILPRWPTLARPIDGIIWTLEIEIFFYAFCFFANRKLKALDSSVFLVVLVSLCVVIAANLVMRTAAASNPAIFAVLHWASSMMQYLPFLLVGTAFHFFYRRRLRAIELVLVQAALLLVFVLSWRLNFAKGDGWNEPVSYLIAYAVFALMFGFRDVVAGLPGLLRRPLSGLADISYSLYVVHGVLGYTIIAEALRAGFGAVPAIVSAIIAALGAAIVIHITVERASRSRGRVLAARDASPVPVLLG